ncbi:hypothetical protein CDL15_Pgr002473 [Punica granatum]|uniref:Uncharacterized protein n=1 Tax=Punica granatum TaxID=22663 RepID=A0A218XVN7_PUNGR|nr:hypothetical protein CDL15_Pgr002473 [Punica granatum]PKI65669.1 hypothetical protein CRG98_013964 [Punica granatum]
MVAAADYLQPVHNQGNHHNANKPNNNQGEENAVGDGNGQGEENAVGDGNGQGAVGDGNDQGEESDADQLNNNNEENDPGEQQQHYVECNQHQQQQNTLAQVVNALRAADREKFQIYRAAIVAELPVIRARIAQTADPNAKEALGRLEVVVALDLF